MEEQVRVAKKLMMVLSWPDVWRTVLENKIKNGAMSSCYLFEKLNQSRHDDQRGPSAGRY